LATQFTLTTRSAIWALPVGSRFASGRTPRNAKFMCSTSAPRLSPDIVDYAKGGISNWRDSQATAAVVRSMLGISPSAWEAAQSVMGEIPAAVVVAAILQRGAAIMSAGGYLRELTRKAAVGEFTLGPS
jgi:hypothetical protein